MKTRKIIDPKLFVMLLFLPACVGMDQGASGKGGKRARTRTVSKAGPSAPLNEELLDCGLQKANTIPEPLERIGLIVELAGSSFKAGIGKKCDAILDGAASEAASIKEYWDRQAALLLVSNAYAEAGRFDDFLAVCDRIEKLEYRVSALTLAAVKAKAAGKEELSDGMLASAVSLGLTISYDFARERTLMGIVQDMAAAGEHDHALAAAAMMEAGYLKDCALEEIAFRLVEEGHYNRANKIIRAASEADHVVRVMRAMAEKQIMDGKAALAAATLARLVRETRKLERKEEILHWLVIAAGMYTDIGQNEKAAGLLMKVKAVVKNIEDARVKVGIMADAAKELARAGRRQAALTMLTDAQSVAQLQEPDVFRDMLFSKIAATRSSVGDKAGAMRLIETMGDNAIIDSALVDLAVQYSEEGSHGNAMITALSIVEPDNRAAAFSAIAEGLLAEGRAGEAHAAALRMDGGMEKAELLLAVAGSYAAKGDAEKTVLHEAAAAAVQVSDKPTRADLTAMIVLMMLEWGMRDDALDVLERAGPMVMALVIGRLVETGVSPDGRFRGIMGRLKCGKGGHGHNVP